MKWEVMLMVLICLMIAATLVSGAGKIWQVLQ